MSVVAEGDTLFTQFDLPAEFALGNSDVWSTVEQELFLEGDPEFAIVVNTNFKLGGDGKEIALTRHNRGSETESGVAMQHLILAVVSIAALSSPTLCADLRVEARWRPGVLELEVGTPAGEHIAPDAPAQGWVNIDDGRLEFETDGRTLARGLIFPFPAASTHEIEGTLALALCRNESSICRPASIAFGGEIVGPRGAMALAEVARDARGSESTLAETDVAAAFSRAKAGDKRVLLDFSALWCPPCQLLAAEVLHDPADAELLAPFEVVLIDADTRASFAWKDRYSIQGYPTVIVADADGEVITRMLGYDGEPAFLAWLESAAVAPTAVSDLLVALDDLPDSELASAARRLLDEGFETEAMTLIARIPDPRERTLLQFRVHPTHELLPTLARDHIDQIMDWIWTVVYELFAEEEVPEASREIVLVAASKGLRQVAPEQAAELAYVLGDLTPVDQHPEHLFALGAAIYRATFTGNPVLDRGRYTFLATLLERTGDREAAIAVMDEAIVAFPAEFTYHFERSELLADGGRPEEALISARQAGDHAYGDTRLRAGKQAAELLVSLGRSEEAIALLKKTLEHAERPKEDEEVRTWRYLELIEELLSELEAE